MSDEKLFGEGFKAQSVEDLDNSGTQEVRHCAKILKRLLTDEQLQTIFPISGNKSQLSGTGVEVLLTPDIIENCFEHYTPADAACYRNLASWQFLKSVTQTQFVEKMEEAEKRGTKPGLFDIFNKGDAAEKKEEAKKEGKGEDEDEDEDEVEDDQEDEIEIPCAQLPAEDPEKKYTTFATKNGFEVMYKLNEDGVQQPAGLENSDEDNDRLVLWNYAENLAMKPVLTLVRVNQYLPHSQKHLVHVIKKFQVPKQPAEETVDFDDENYRILTALAPAAALPEPAEEEAEANAEAGAAPAAEAKPEAAAAPAAEAKAEATTEAAAAPAAEAKAKA
ncbi:hypothetical protein CYMTET_3116, partial [Cymbomonas tetramitiformis]